MIQCVVNSEPGIVNRAEFRSQNMLIPNPAVGAEVGSKQQTVNTQTRQSSDDEQGTKSGLHLLADQAFQAACDEDSPDAETPNPHQGSTRPTNAAGPLPIDKYASTRLAGTVEVISQDVLHKTICKPGAGAAEVTQLFSFWRPRSTNPGRRSTVLTLSEKQQDMMYALAGCSDVVFLISRVNMGVRKAIEEQYSIDKYNFATWFKNRGRNPSKNYQSVKRPRDQSQAGADQAKSSPSKVWPQKIGDLPPSEPKSIAASMYEALPRPVTICSSESDSHWVKQQLAARHGTHVALQQQQQQQLGNQQLHLAALNPRLVTPEPRMMPSLVWDHPKGQLMRDLSQQAADLSSPLTREQVPLEASSKPGIISLTSSADLPAVYNSASQLQSQQVPLIFIPTSNQVFGQHRSYDADSSIGINKHADKMERSGHNAGRGALNLSIRPSEDRHAAQVHAYAHGSRPRSPVSAPASSSRGAKSMSPPPEPATAAPATTSISDDRIDDQPSKQHKTFSPADYYKAWKPVAQKVRSLPVAATPDAPKFGTVLPPTQPVMLSLPTLLSSGLLLMPSVNLSSVNLSRSMDLQDRSLPLLQSQCLVQQSPVTWQQLLLANSNTQQPQGLSQAAHQTHLLQSRQGTRSQDLGVPYVLLNQGSSLHNPTAIPLDLCSGSLSGSWPGPLTFSLPPMTSQLEAHPR